MINRKPHPERVFHGTRTALALVGSAVLLSLADLNAQTTPAPMPGICNRACWGARASCSFGTLSSLTRAIIHHTAGTGDWTTDYEAGKAKVRGIQNYHMNNNGWCDIGYHFLVSAGGHIYEGINNAIPGWPRGAHDCANDRSFGFNIMGYFHPPYNQVATTAQRSSLYDVIAWKMPAGWNPKGFPANCYNLAGGVCGTACKSNVGSLDGHREVTSTACPGDGMWVYIGMDAYGGEARNSVEARRTPAPPPPTYINPPYYFDGGTDGWTAGNNLTATWWTASGWPGVLVTDQIGADAYMHSPPTNFGGAWDTTINVNVYPQNGTTAGHDMQVFWKTTAEDFWDAGKSSPMIGYTAKDQWIRVNLDVNHAKWAGQTMKQLRLDFDQNNQGVRWIVNHIIPQGTPRWWFNSSAEGWTIGNALTGLTWYNTGWPGIIYADQTGPDAYFYSPSFSYLGGANDKLFVKVYPQNGNTAYHQIKVYWITASDPNWNEAKSSETIYFTAQNTWADLGIRVGANVNWYSDFVTKIRLDVDGNSANSQVRWIIDYVAIMPQTQQQTIAPVPDVIVDNPSATVTGTWTTGSSATDKYGADYRYKSKGTGTAYLQYTPNVGTAGNYNVYEFHPQGANRTTVAPHVITHTGGTSTVNVNQQVNGGTWNLLGTFNFAAGTAGNIRITDGFTDAGSVVMSDAIKLVYVP